MIKFIKQQKQPVALVCDKVDRLQRGFKELTTLDELRRNGKLVLHFYTEGQILDQNSASSQIMIWQMHIMMAENYTNCISDNVRRSFNQMRKDGFWTGTAPIGYLNKRNDNERRSNVILDNARAPYIRRLFEEYSTGLYSFEVLRDKSEKWGLRNKSKRNTCLSTSQIEVILKNPFYCGIMHIKSKGQLLPHKYPTIVSESLFKKCQQVKAMRNNRSCKIAPKAHIFSGLVTCKCGQTISPEIVKNNHYLRPTKRCVNNCGCARLREKDVLSELTGVLSRIQIPVELLEVYKSNYERAIGLNNELREQTLKFLQDDYKKKRRTNKPPD